MSGNPLVRVGLLIAIAAAAAGWSAPAAAQPLHPAAVRDVAAELACGPTAVEALPLDALRLAGGAVAGKVLFGAGETVVVRGGSASGLKPGQQFYVRRIVSDRFTPSVRDGISLHSVHTAGWIRIADVQRETAAATVTHACGELMEGDYLEPFALPEVPATAPAGTEDFSSPGRLILADERRQVGSAGSLMVLDRGASHGLRPGQRVTIFRLWPNGGPLVRVGDATAVVVGPARSTVRIERSSDAIYVGDLAAIQR